MKTLIAFLLTFTAAAPAQAEGWAVSLKYGEVIVSGFYNGTPKTPVLTQMNCRIRSER